MRNEQSCPGPLLTDTLPSERLQQRGAALGAEPAFFGRLHTFPQGSKHLVTKRGASWHKDKLSEWFTGWYSVWMNGLREDRADKWPVPKTSLAPWVARGGAKTTVMCGSLSFRRGAGARTQHSCLSSAFPVCSALSSVYSWEGAG